MLGAPLGGAMRGAHQTFDPSRVSLITPPNFGSGAGSWFPLTVVVALGWPNVPVTTCATAAALVNATASRTIVAGKPFNPDRKFILYPPEQTGTCLARRHTLQETLPFLLRCFLRGKFRRIELPERSLHGPRHLHQFS
jgi:hypothetical protein